MANSAESEPNMSQSRTDAAKCPGTRGPGTASLALPEAAVRAQEAARRGRPPLKITDVKTILTQPGGEHLVVVKVLTSEPGLYGVGCATHGERPLAVAAAIDQHVKPLLIGKECDRIEDIWQTSYVASYFRSGVTLNNALSGIDGALWDILGKQAGLPVYKLLGGKVREAVPLYAHASAKELPALEDQVRQWQAQGYRHVRVQLAVPGYATYGAAGETSEDVQQARPAGIAPRPSSSPRRMSTTRSRCSSICAQARLRRRAAPRRPRARAAGPGHPAREGPGAVPAVLPRGLLRARGRGLVPAPPRRRRRRRWRWASCSSTATSGCRW